MIKITFCFLSFRSTLITLILVSFWFILPYSVVIPLCSVIFRYHSGTILVYSVSFRCHSVLFQSHSSLFRHIPAYSGIFRFICVSFHFIPVSFWLVSVYFQMASRLHHFHREQTACRSVYHSLRFLSIAFFCLLLLNSLFLVVV